LFQFQIKHFPDAEESLPTNYNYKDLKVLMVFVKSFASNNPMEFFTKELHPDYAINVTYNIFSNFKFDKNLMKIPKLFFFDASTYPSTCLDDKGNYWHTF
jgi:hypothetical protein